MSSAYALTNPLVLLVNKPREDFTREYLVHVIEGKRIERITFHYTALDGKLKELKLPIANRYQAERILADGERVDGSSLFRGMVHGDGSLSVEAKKVIGGLCEYADLLTALGNTESAAYLRLVPNQEAPTRVCWSDSNRSAMIRVPLGWSKVDNLAHSLNAPQRLLLKQSSGPPVYGLGARVFPR
jgi:glutamine synthetase